MSGYAYGEKEPLEKCPYCGTWCTADFVDIGVGYQLCGPYHCDNCLASEIGPYDEDRELSAKENDCGWYEPDSEPGSSANVIGGRVVSYKQAEAAYREEFTGNPDYEIPGLVENWWKEQRKVR